MFICVKYGDQRQLLANINCSVLLLTHYLREKVGLHRTDPIDLCEENGTLKLLFLVKFLEDSASKFLTPRTTYYICKVERGTPGALLQSYGISLPPPWTLAWYSIPVVPGAFQKLVDCNSEGSKQESSYRAFHPMYKHPPAELLDALRNQCDLLEKNRLKILKSTDGKKTLTMETLLTCMAMANQVAAQGKTSGKSGASSSGGQDDEGQPRKTTTSSKTRWDASKKHR